MGDGDARSILNFLSPMALAHERVINTGCTAVSPLSRLACLVGLPASQALSLHFASLNATSSFNAEEYSLSTYWVWLWYTIADRWWRSQSAGMVQVQRKGPVLLVPHNHPSSSTTPRMRARGWKKSDTPKFRTNLRSQHNSEMRLELFEIFTTKWFTNILSFNKISEFSKLLLFFDNFVKSR